jgi:hypothetical protein
MILLLNALLLISSKIKDQKISYYFIGFIVFLGLVLNAIEVFNNTLIDISIFHNTSSINYLLLFLWSLVLVKVAIYFKNKEPIRIDWKSFALINLAAIPVIPVAIIIINIFHFIFSEDESDVDYKKGSLYFISLYCWLILCLFGATIESSVVRILIDLNTFVVIIGLLTYILKTFSFKKISYSLATIAIIREMLGSLSSEYVLYAEIMIFVLLTVWTILILEVDKSVLKIINKYPKIERAFLKLKLLLNEKKINEIESIEFKQLVGTKSTGKVVKIKNIVENDIRVNMILILVLLNILIVIFQIGTNK